MKNTKYWIEVSHRVDTDLTWESTQKKFIHILPSKNLMNGLNKKSPTYKRVMNENISILFFPTWVIAL